MIAFEKVHSGLEGLDKALDYIRLGDNVVFQVSGLEEYKFFTEPFVRSALSRGKRLIYIRFAAHGPIVPELPGVARYTLDAAAGFESFTVSVHSIITREGRGALYVFDCLSDLQVAWYTDLMMGNFFRVTCPYLFTLDTVAYFPVLRAHHSFETLARIRETTQLLLDVYSDGEVKYLHPLKVWNRYSPEMFLPHRVYADGAVSPLTNGVEVSKFYALLSSRSTFQGQQNVDSYERFFQAAKESFLNGAFTKTTARRITRSMLTRDEKMSALILEHFEPHDFFMIKDRIIGTGTVGGKSCGMLLARKLLEKYLPRYRERLEPHDSFFIGTDVFYSYIVDNGCWEIKIRQKSGEEYFSAGETLRERLRSGRFSEGVRDQFRRMLEYFGQSPIIVRSSSFLEDGFGSVFAGKYESVFCANSASPAERLEIFENAVREVYASTMDASALEYRRSRGLEDSDEQMAILVQRVSGTKFGDCFMPCAAGTGFSYSLYRWSEDLDKNAGILRLVAGLGTRAVDRTGNDYPRLVNLDQPGRSPLTDAGQRHRFSQRYLDIIELSQNTVVEKPISALFPILPAWYRSLITERDREAQERLRQLGREDDVVFVSCRGIVENGDFIAQMKDILAMLEEKYSAPVDIEYTVNFNHDGSFVVSLLQCRPLAVWKAAQTMQIPQCREEDVLFRIRDSFMGNAAQRKIDCVVWVDSKGYYGLPHAQKSKVTAAIDRINSFYKGSGKSLMLAAPGRLGTAMPELGVPVRFSNISAFGILCEYADSENGYMPELSYGSHMFQDMVEADMFYAAVLDSGSTLVFRREFWEGKESVFQDICPEMAELSSLIRVYDTAPDGMMLYADLKSQTALCARGFYGN